MGSLPVLSCHLGSLPAHSEGLGPQPVLYSLRFVFGMFKLGFRLLWGFAALIQSLSLFFVGRFRGQLSAAQYLFSLRFNLG
jgi:hypothetical protein